MKNSKEILEIMIGDHALIDVLLLVFKDSLDKEPEVIEKALNEFSWELEKHLFVEEVAIFRFCNSPDSTICKIVQNLIGEHDTMVEMLNEIRNDLAMNKEIDISKFSELLKNHQKIEEKSLYPKIDEELSKEQKDIIISRINEIPLKKGTDVA